MSLPPLTTKQQEILHLLYSHRFLNRIQIQTFLHHKDKRRIISWLKDMRDKEYIVWIYDKNNFMEKSKPAVYYLNLNGIRFLKSLGQYAIPELRKRYREGSRQPSFVTHCVQLADYCLTLQSKNSVSADVKYSYVRDPTRATPDFVGGTLNDLRPDLYFMKQDGRSSNVVTTHFLLDILPSTLPRYRVRKRLKDYVTYLSSGVWQYKMNTLRPVVLLACPTTAELLYVKRFTRKLLETTWDNEVVHIRFATVDKVKQQGMTSLIWEEA